MNGTAWAAQAPQIKAAEFETDRLKREWKTVSVMIECYCRGLHHSASDLCPECQGLSDYACQRLRHCRFGTEKPTCASCPIRCYQRSRREQVRVVMRYAGPRMVWRHPFLCLRHWLDSFRK
ncbi:MAG TPA: nitrous oxide-stimulated promoter family protein, partial [Verrucomicrobiae bacterium]|nr:nitrous oxide-stimulated promoter family protein [Verrucomicrobiae bacterium]